MSAIQGTPPAIRQRGFRVAVAESFGLVGLGLMIIVIGTWLLGLMLGERDQAAKVVTLALPALLAGSLSVLSPCSFPIMLGYFSITFQQQPQRIGAITLAFLLGVGTTMSVLGASFTALGSLAIDYQEQMAQIGGVLIIGFGLMTLLGKGFSGLGLTRSTGAGSGAAYLFGLMFALGWTACVGPILGSILTMLLADGASSSGTFSIISGAALAQVYVLGMGLPILILVMALVRGVSGRDVGKLIQGREFTLAIANRQLALNWMSLISGLLLIGLGLLLLTGAMTRLTQELGSSWISQWVVRLEEHLPT